MRLVAHFASLRKTMLERMGALSDASTDDEIKSVMGAWQRFKIVVGDWTNQDVMTAEPPDQYFEAWVYPTAAWRNFDRLRSKRKQRRPDIRAKRAKRDKIRYQTFTRAQRSTPEAKALLAQRKREERARKRLAAERAEEEALATVLENI